MLNYWKNEWWPIDTSWEVCRVDWFSPEQPKWVTGMWFLIVTYATLVPTGDLRDIMSTVCVSQKTVQVDYHISMETTIRKREDINLLFCWLLFFYWVTCGCVWGFILIIFENPSSTPLPLLFLSSWPTFLFYSFSSFLLCNSPYCFQRLEILIITNQQKLRCGCWTFSVLTPVTIFRSWKEEFDFLEEVKVT